MKKELTSMLFVSELLVQNDRVGDGSKKFETVENRLYGGQDWER
jgi:hypothetical protein